MTVIRQPALSVATESLERSLLAVMGVKVRGNTRRVAERVIGDYLKACAEDTLRSRMKAETLAMMHMEVGEEIEVHATCKQNLHGQQKTIRRKTGNPRMKWRVTDLGQLRWRVRRMPDSDDVQLGKPAEWNAKAVFLADLKAGGPPGTFENVRRPFDIIGAFNKNKAREILGDYNAEWKTKTIDGTLWVWRIR